MARLVRFEDLRESVRTRYKLPAFDADGFVTLDEVNAMINASLASFYAMLMEAYGDEYFSATQTITTTAGLSVDSLPDRCTKLMSLHWVRGTDDVVPIQRGTKDDMMLAAYSAQAWTTYEPKYLPSGQAIQWLPTPNAAYTVLAAFAQLPVDLVDDNDTFEAGPGWDEWVVADVCRKIAESEDQDVRKFMTARDSHEAKIRTQKPRNEALQRQVVDRRGVRAPRMRDFRGRGYPWLP